MELGKYAKGIVDAHVRAAEEAMRTLRPRAPAAPRGARARPQSVQAVATPPPRLAFLTAVLRRALHVKPQPIAKLDARTHIRIKSGLNRLERIQKLEELGILKP